MGVLPPTNRPEMRVAPLLVLQALEKNELPLLFVHLTSSFAEVREILASTDLLDKVVKIGLGPLTKIAGVHHRRARIPIVDEGENQHMKLAHPGAI